MESNLASGDLISDRYALALYELSIEDNLADVILDDLKLLKSIIVKNSDLNLLVKSPLITSNDKLEILLKLTKQKTLNKLTKNFLNILSKNKRFKNLVSIISQYININAQKRGEILAHVISAEDLSDDQKENIKDKLNNILGKKLLLDFKVDKKIIGGLIVKVGSKMIDISLLNKISKIKIAMKGA